MVLRSEVLQGIVHRGVEEITERELEVYRRNVAKWMTELVSDIPVYSGYAASNVRLEIRSSKGQFTSGSGKRGNFPAEKAPWARFEYIDNIGDNLAQELSKLDELEVTDIVIFQLDIDYDNRGFEIAMAFENVQALADLYSG